MEKFTIAIKEKEGQAVVESFEITKEQYDEILRYDLFWHEKNTNYRVSIAKDEEELKRLKERFAKRKKALDFKSDKKCMIVDVAFFKALCLSFKDLKLRRKFINYAFKIDLKNQILTYEKSA